MSTQVTLKHTLHTLPVRYEFFYDGQAVAEDGLLTLPVDNLSHIRAAFFRGYRITPEGERLDTFEDLDRYIESQTAKSAEETDVEEGTDTRGLTPDKDRVRKSKSNRRQKVSE